MNTSSGKPSPIFFYPFDKLRSLSGRTTRVLFSVIFPITIRGAEMQKFTVLAVSLVMVGLAACGAASAGEAGEKEGWKKPPEQKRCIKSCNDEKDERNSDYSEPWPSQQQCIRKCLRDHPSIPYTPGKIEDIIEHFGKLLSIASRTKQSPEIGPRATLHLSIANVVEDAGLGEEDDPGEPADGPRPDTDYLPVQPLPIWPNCLPGVDCACPNIDAMDCGMPGGGGIPYPYPPGPLPQPGRPGRWQATIAEVGTGEPSVRHSSNPNRSLHATKVPPSFRVTGIGT